jgi:3'-phosphoadenosine 5'-phosphosulfate sulfotransferase (PAPS reductase)/FAD synthetase
MKHIVSFSGGKDSTAMLLMMIEKDMPIDEIIFCDTGKEFPAMYDHIEQVEQYIGRKVIRLKAKRGFDYWFGEHIKKKGERAGQPGYGWPNMLNRWCTGELKRKLSRHYLKGLECIKYHGIAYDEPKRIDKNQGRNIQYPLYEWGITERQTLQYCYDKGFDWGGLYKIFNRVSCWCCPLQSLRELENLYLYFPDLWERLKEMDKRAFNQFKADYSVEQLEQRFEKKLKNYSVSFFPIKRKEAEKNDNKSGDLELSKS